MELYKDIIIRILEDSEIKIGDLDKIVASRCYKALNEILRIIKTPELEDKECFMRMENIIVELENLGCDCGFRHDFG